MAKLAHFFSKLHGRLRVDDKRVASGINFINRNGLRWRDAPKEYGPHETAPQPVEALERERYFRQNDDRAGRRTGRGKARDDRRELSESAPHPDQRGLEKGGAGAAQLSPKGRLAALGSRP